MHEDRVSGELRHVVVVAHPEAHSFNAQVAAAYAEAVRSCGQVVVLRDLYGLRFAPVLQAEELPSRGALKRHPDVEAELAIMGRVDVLVLVYPIWFGSPPAMLKGYVERVLGAGLTPAALQERAGTGLLNGARLVSITSSAARESWLAEVGQDLSLQNVFDCYLQHAFAMRGTEHLHFGGVVEGLCERTVAQHLQTVRERARATCAALAYERNRARAAACQAPFESVSLP